MDQNLQNFWDTKKNETNLSNFELLLAACKLQQPNINQFLYFTT